MTEKYILVSDDEYCYTLDTSDENYKTLEDFEKQEFENAKKANVDIGEYEDAIWESARDNYWNWVYNSHLEVDTVNDILNQLSEENEQLKSDNKEYIKGLEKAKATSQSWASDVRELREQNCQLEKENEQLKSDLKELHEICAYYEMRIKELNGDDKE